MSEAPGKGFLGWLGRQIGYVAKAAKADVVPPKVLYREDTTEELPHPTDPTLKLRRTVIDEVVVEKPKLQRDAHATGQTDGRDRTGG